MRLTSVIIALALSLISFSVYAQTAEFPCASFRMQPNGLLEVVESVTLTTPTGQTVILRPGTRIGPGLKMGSLDVYELHRRSCR